MADAGRYRYSPLTDGARQRMAVIAGLSPDVAFFELLRRIERSPSQGIRLRDISHGSYGNLHIVQPADMSFAPGEVQAVEQKIHAISGQQQVIIVCRHFGLFAPYGPLPIHMTEHARHQRLLKRNTAFEHFISLLTQRLAVLHYRAWSNLHVALGYENPLGNAFMGRLQKINGFADLDSRFSDYQRVRNSVPAAFLPGRGNLKNLQQILVSYFSIPLTIIPRYPSWIEDPDNRHLQVLGRMGATRLGKRFFDCQHTVKLRIGPLAYPDYLDFQAGGRRLGALLAICRDFVSHQLLFNVELLMTTTPDLSAKLGRWHLGKSGWLKTNFSIYSQPIALTQN